MRKLILAMTILAGAAAGQTTPPAVPPAALPPAYSIDAIRYATLKAFPLSGLIPNAPRGQTLDIAMTVWLVRGGGHTVLVDAGFYRPQNFTQYKYDGYTKPSDALAWVGLKPENVTDLIITHMHWDHADGMDLFPKAKVWIQKDEYVYYTGEAWQSRRTHGGIDPEDVLAIVKANTEGRVMLVDGDAKTILPGITVYTGGKHTYASQYAGVTTAAGIVVLASDNVYLYANLEQHVPIAETLDAASNLAAQDRMKQLATSGIIIPGHDPAVFTKYPNPVPNVAKIQ